MSLYKFIDIPSASELLDEIAEKKDLDKEAKLAKKMANDFYLELGQTEYTNDILSSCQNAIKNVTSSTKTRLCLRDISDKIKHGHYTEKNIPCHVLHYGHIDGYWTKRKPLAVSRGFLVARQIMLEKGYYLVDESDPSKSFQIFISLYLVPPIKNKKLWHGLNNIM